VPARVGVAAEDVDEASGLHGGSDWHEPG
jgi:hypothetical protein